MIFCLDLFTSLSSRQSFSGFWVWLFKGSRFGLHINKITWTSSTISIVWVIELLHWILFFSTIAKSIYIICSCSKSTQVLCIIFVERIIAAKVVERFVKKVPFLTHLTVAYLTGSTTSVDALTPKVQKEVLESFRGGKVSNLLYC